MAPVEHALRLKSEEHFGIRLPPHHLGYLLAELPPAVGQSIAMAIQNRSTVKGKKPKWLRRAADIRFIGHQNGDGVTLHFEAERLGDAAPELFEQGTLFADLMPDADATGFDLLRDVLADIRSGNEDSDHFDTPLLSRVARFHKFFARGPFDAIVFPSRQDRESASVELNPALIDSAKSLCGRTPIPQRVRLVGKLDGIEASTKRFSLVLDTGDKVPGVFADGQMDVMQRLWRERVLVLGSAIYRPSGRLLRIDAEEVRVGKNEPSLFSRMPISRTGKLDPTRMKQSQGPRSGMAAIAGTWPGEESDDEIEAALEQLS